MFRKLVKSLTGRSDESQSRQLSTVADLRSGDLISFKERLALPAEMQGQTYEVSEVTSYQFDDGLYMQLTLIALDRSKIYLGFEPDEPMGELCFSKPLSTSEISVIFGEDQFGELWEEGFATLSANDVDVRLTPWLTESYRQHKNQAVAYYFNKDMRGERLSDRFDDGSEELRYHECIGSDDKFELTVEVWDDGETDVTLDLYCPADVVELMWPAK